MRILGLCLFALLNYALATGALAQNVPREKPKIYEETLSKLLTPLEDVLKTGENYAKDESGVILISEKITFQADDGRYYRLYREVSRALSESGAKTLEKEEYSFRKKEEKLTLIEARTIQPDGSKTPVRPNAAIIQDQQQTGNSLYEDRAELILIFPDVKPGSVVESIVLISRDSGFRIPGEYMSQISWDSNIWPAAEKRVILDVPRSLADELKINQLGARIPQPKVETFADQNRSRFTWSKSNRPRRKYVRNTPPSRQTGPASFMTTWDSWDDLANWYADLLKDRSTLTPELEKMAQRETAKLKSRKEVIETFYSKVANDVRYVGLEFGIAGLQPYSCGDVWKNKYGDCKDKSNLLVNLLRSKGIEAYMALVDTKHGGNVYKRNPSYLPFNHAIVALAPSAPGEDWQFMDPTIDRAPAGTLGQWTAGRDVLILKGNEAIWAKTPRGTAGRLDFDFTLEVEPTGRISGWIEVDSDGYYAASYADSFAELGRDLKIEEARKIAARFFPKARVIDLEHDDILPRHETFRLKAFFEAPFPAVSEEESHMRISFPETGMYLPWLGEERDRKEPWHLWKDTTTVNLDIGMGKGWSPGKTPPPISVGSDTIAASGRWKREAERLKADFEIVLKKSDLRGGAFAAAFNAVESLTSWLKRTAEFTRSGNVGEEPTEPAEVTSVEMPIMPSGEGQMNLVNSRYPVRSGIPKRRAALQKVLQFFPNAPGTQFDAKVQLAYLKYLEDKNAESVGMIDSVLKQYRNKVDLEDAGLARYIKALALGEVEETRKKGITEMTALCRNEQLSDYRRAWAAYHAAMWQKDDAPKKGLDLLEKHLSFAAEGFQIAAFSLYSKLAIAAGQTKELSRRLATLVENREPFASPVLNKLVEDAAEGIYSSDSKDSKNSKGLHQIILDLDLDAIRSSDDELDKAVTSLQDQLDSQGTLQSLYGELRTLLSSKDLPSWIKPLSGNYELKTAEEYSEKLGELDGDGGSDFVPLAIEYFQKFPPRQDFAKYLWRFASHAEWHERPSSSRKETDDENSFFDRIIAIAEKLPHSNDYYWECQFTKGAWLRHRERFAEEGEVYLKMIKHPKFDDSFLISASYRAGMALEKAHRFDEAEAAYMHSRPKADEFASAVDSLTRTVLIRLETGNEDGAFELLDEIRKIDKDIVKKSSYSTIIGLLLEFTEDREAAKNYWKKTAGWWEDLIDLCQMLPGASDYKSQPRVGLIDNSDRYSHELSESVEAKDGMRFLKAFEMPAHLARWLPDELNELARVSLFGAIPLQPAKAVEWRSLIAEIYEGVEPVSKSSMGDFLLYYVAALADEKPDQAIEVCRTYFLEHNTENTLSPASEAIARIWGISAIAWQDRDEAAAAINQIQSQLDSGESFSRRHMSINGLANLHRFLGNHDEEKELLAKELEHPRIKADSSAAQSLKDRLRNLAETIGTRTAIGESVRQWKAGQDLSWMTLSDPKSLEDRRLRDLEEFVSEGSNGFDRFETAKAMLLAAEKGQVSSESAWEAFKEAIDTVYSLSHQRSQRIDLYRSILALDSIPDHLRAFFVYMGCIVTAEGGDEEAYQFFRNHKAAKALWSPNDNRRKLFDLLVKAVARDGAARLNFVRQIAKDSVTGYELSFIRTVYTELCEYGFEKESEEIRESVADWVFDKSVDETATSVKIDLLKRRRQFRSLQEANKQLTDLVKTRFPDYSPHPDYSDFYPSHLPPGASGQFTHQILRQALDEGRCGWWEHREWFELCESLLTSPETTDLRFELAQICLEHAANDLSRSFVMLDISNLVDTDDQEILDRIEKELFAPWEKKKSAHPLTWDAIVYQRTAFAFRKGTLTSPEDALSRIKHPYLSSALPILALRFALAKDDQAMMKRAINRMSSDEWISDRYIVSCLKALKRTGMTDEYELVREEALRSLRRNQVEAWASGDPGSIQLALGLVDTLDLGEEYKSSNRDWFVGAMAKTDHIRHRLEFASKEALIREDWDEALSFSQELVKEFPTFYGYYRYLAEAARQLGKKKIAADAYQVFLKYVNNHSEYKEAESLYQKLKGG